MTERVIIHVDMDAFYASVEQRDRPELRGKPVIVGGTGRRGVVAAASYEVRRFGVRSAMPVSQARRRCPDLIAVAPRMHHYAAESKRIFEILRRFSPQIEPLSLDEAFLDVTASLRLHGGGRAIGARIKHEIRAETGLTASVGVAPNKFLAKLASDQDKPDGLFIVDSARVRQFLDPLPVRRIWGIGPKAAARLKQIGIAKIGELRAAHPDRIRALLGSHGPRLQELARGEDQREVVVERPEKSISHEVTFDQDLTDSRACENRLLALSGQVGARLRRGRLRGKTVSIKVRTGEFRTHTRQRTLSAGVDDDRTIARTARALFTHWWRERGPASIRLLGVGVAGLSAASREEELFGQATDGRLDRLKDQVRARFGGAAIRPASLVGDDED